MSENREQSAAIEALRSVGDEQTQTGDIAQHDGTPQGAEEIDRIVEAQTDEQVEHYNSRREIRKSIGKASVMLVWSASIFAVIISCIYIGCLAAEPYVEHVKEVKENFEILFFKMFDLLPWILLFLFGDIKKLSETVMQR